MIEEMRLRDLGVIAEATLPIGAGFTAITGETGAGKTMVVTGLGLLLGQRADSGAVRAGATQATVDGVWIVPEDGPVAARVRDQGGAVDLAHVRAGVIDEVHQVDQGTERHAAGGVPSPLLPVGQIGSERLRHRQSTEQRRSGEAADRAHLPGGVPSLREVGKVKARRPRPGDEDSHRRDLASAL